MSTKWYEVLTGQLQQKKQYKEAKARLDALPEPYRATATALNRYFMYFGGITDGDTLVQMFIDHADLWERASIDRLPLREVVGEDPVEFAENFTLSYGGKQWIDKERARLIKAVQDAKRSEES
ncbi:hypothetical protein CQ019_13965 [Arthrobacter sp. MYb229]|uniref:DUF1048 domain-containing protein n=1 Tax=unclassified Arthrobacter TaxID=235627 RepID=UPI000CFD4C52|nr:MULTISPECIES: DUF1048 domain-containing protein [unclassified Arthrobacter]PRA01863.1 hypothetical protein CQ019_13965 [Arthrobacter sp. MYb229]PRB50372.1 hypothetical protein CQ013_10130 [Arthrobacter sp. MYb216]